MVSYRLSSNVFLGVSILAFSVLFPPFEELAIVDLSAHMLEHVLIVLSGTLIAYPYLSSKIKEPSKYGTISFIVISVLVIYWHLPEPWDSAVTIPYFHALEHLCFLASGLIIGSILIRLSDLAKISMMLAAFFGHTFYAILLIFPSGKLYPIYSYADQYLYGVLMLLAGSLLIVGIGYVLVNNPQFLKQLGIDYVKKRQTKRVGNKRNAKFVFSISLFAILIIYYSLSSFAIAQTSTPKDKAVVYISETPFYWNFSPPKITVKVGVNNTVTWISRSTSYDTVTSVSNDFSSGPIPPGGSFSYTFTKPGVYEYFCVYHPWMRGEVIVVP